MHLGAFGIAGEESVHRPTAQLFGALGGDVNEEKPLLHREHDVALIRGRRLGRRFWLNEFFTHNLLAYFTDPADASTERRPSDRASLPPRRVVAAATFRHAE